MKATAANTPVQADRPAENWAAVFRGPGQLGVEALPYPQVPADGLILKVMACGICGGDLRTYQHGLRIEKDWQILGHELNGVVVDVGENVEDYQIGDRLAIAADVSCQHCYYCRRGLYNLCDRWELLGAHHAGGLQQYMTVTEAILRRGIVHRIPAGLDHIQAALSEPMSSVLASQHNIGIDLGETVAILGAGPIGCLHVEIAKARGARPIILERIPERLEFAVSLGVEAAILADDDTDVIAAVQALTEGRGADVAIVAAPSKSAQDQAVRMVRRRGRVVLFGGLPKHDPLTSLDSNIIHYSELTIFGAFSYHPRFHQIALDLLARGRIQTEKIITGVYPLELLLDAFQAAMTGQEVKVIITPNS